MRPVQIDDQVTLRVNIPEKRLHSGQVGIIRDIAPGPEYEVEFYSEQSRRPKRVTLPPDRIELQGMSPFDQGIDASGNRLYF